MGFEHDLKSDIDFNDVFELRRDDVKASEIGLYRNVLPFIDCTTEKRDKFPKKYKNRSTENFTLLCLDDQNGQDYISMKDVTKPYATSWIYLSSKVTDCEENE